VRAPFALALLVLAVLPGAALAGHGKGGRRPMRFDLPNAVRARPDDGQPDPAGTHKWSGPEAGNSPYCTGHFCVHFTATGADASNLSYAKQLGDVLENEVYPCENGIGPTACAGRPGLGWRDAAPDDGLGGNDKTDIYIQELHDSEDVFGYTSVDPGQAQDPSVPHHAYMVMDNDYTRYEPDHSAAAGLAVERVTAAHEYNHVLQDAYDYLEDSWMFEATAVYMEDKVYPDDNDYLGYVDSWVANTKQPLTAFPSSNLKAYGSAVWNHWLDHEYGPAAVRQSWEDSIGAADFAPGAYGAAISADGGGGFSQEFDRFSAAVAEWNVPGEGFPDHYPDVPRDGTLPADTQTEPFALPHTTFAFFDVPVPGDAPRTIRLTGTLPTGTAGAVALVGRTGADPNGGTVTTSLTPMPSGGTGAVLLDDPAQFARITAVVVNADASQSGFDQAVDDYVFTKDAPAVVASMAEPGAPIPVTGAPGLIGDHAAVAGGTVDPHLNQTSWSVEYGRTTRYGSRTAPQRLPASTVGAPSVVTALRNLRSRTAYHYRLVASNSAGATVGLDHVFRTARDVTPPRLKLAVGRQGLRVGRGVVYRASCSERCRGSARLIRSGVVWGKSRLVLEGRPRASTLRVRLDARAKRFLAGKRGRIKAQLRVEVRDAARNATTVTKQVVFSP
jgi:hypothetical protein